MAVNKHKHRHKHKIQLSTLFCQKVENLWFADDKVKLLSLTYGHRETSKNCIMNLKKASLFV